MVYIILLCLTSIFYLHEFYNFVALFFSDYISSIIPVLSLPFFLEKSLFLTNFYISIFMKIAPYLLLLADSFQGFSFRFFPMLFFPTRLFWEYSSTPHGCFSSVKAGFILSCLV